jgi:hypothetical protein
LCIGVPPTASQIRPERKRIGPLGAGVTAFSAAPIALGARPHQASEGPTGHRLVLPSEIGERAIAIVVRVVSRHFAVANVQDRRPVPFHLPNIQPARLASPTEVVEDEDMLIIELDVLIRLDASVLPRIQDAVRSSPSGISSISHMRFPKRACATSPGEYRRGYTTEQA